MHFITILTANRPPALAECAKTVAAALRSSASTTSLTVLDDSRVPESIASNKTIVAEVSREYGLPIEHRTVSDGISMISESPAQASDNPYRLHTLKPAATGITTAGANRNIAQLLTAGNKLISCDDDLRFVFSRFSLSHCESEPSGPPKDDTTPFVSKKNLAGLFATGYFLESDEIDGVSQPGPTDVLDQMLTSLEGPCNMVMTGIRGNRWFDRPSQFYHLEGPLRDQVYRNKKTYRSTRLGPHALTQVPYRLTTDAPVLVTACSGYDNRKLMPPFPPIGRSEDAVFGLLVRYMYPDSVTTHLPCCVHHDLVPPRPVTEEQFMENTFSYGFMTYLVVRLLAHRSASETVETAKSAEMRLMDLGARLRSATAVRTDDWWDNLHELAIQHATQQVAHLELLLERYNEKPSWWAQDVYRFIDDLVLHAGERSTAVPRELRSAMKPEAAVEHHRAFCHHYGELLQCWPEIWNRAAERNTEG